MEETEQTINSGEEMSTTSIQFPKAKLRELSIRALQLGFRSRNELLCKIIRDWYEQDKALSNS